MQPVKSVCRVFLSCMTTLQQKSVAKKHISQSFGWSWRPNCLDLEANSKWQPWSYVLRMHTGNNGCVAAEAFGAVPRRGGPPIAILLALCALPAVSGTCATFSAWLRYTESSVGSDHFHAFVALHIAPDAKSVVVTMQVTGNAGASAVNVMSAGIFGPALPGQDKPAGRGALLDLLPKMTVRDLEGGMTFTRTLRLESPSLQETLTFMREGRTYVSVITHSMASVGRELRGWLEVPECHEARLTGLPRTGDDGQPVMPYAFANVLISPSESSFALLLQVATDASRAFPGTISEANVRDASGVAFFSSESSGLSLSNSKFFYEMPHRQDPGQLEKIFLTTGEVNRADETEKVYRVGHNVGPNVIIAMKAVGVIVEIKSSTPNYLVAGNLDMAKPCRQLVTTHDSLFSIARGHGSDWLTVWSMNDGNPDARMLLEPRYYAHPFQVTSGDTSAALLKRFGMSESQLFRNNPTLQDVQRLAQDSFLCIVPNWQDVYGASGQKICAAAA